MSETEAALTQVVESEAERQPAGVSVFELLFVLLHDGLEDGGSDITVTGAHGDHPAGQRSHSGHLRVHTQIHQTQEHTQIKRSSTETHTHLHAGFGVSHDRKQQRENILPVRAGVRQTQPTNTKLRYYCTVQCTSPNNNHTFIVTLNWVKIIYLNKKYYILHL